MSKRYNHPFQNRINKTMFLAQIHQNRSYILILLILFKTFLQAVNE